MALCGALKLTVWGPRNSHVTDPPTGIAMGSGVKVVENASWTSWEKTPAMAGGAAFAAWTAGASFATTSAICASPSAVTSPGLLTSVAGSTTVMLPDIPAPCSRQK